MSPFNYMLTIEQQNIVDAVCGDTKGIIAVNAVAGSGKTSTAKAIVDAYKPTNGFYTAFNKAIVTDSSKKFNTGIKCKTIHAFAYQYIKPSDIVDFNYNSIKESTSYENKLEVIQLIDKFFRSSATDMYEYFQANTESEKVYTLACKYAERMFNNKIPPTFNFLLKRLHLALVNNEVGIDKDLLILDECQDTTAVTLEIFKLINANRKVILGDKFQNIYSWMNTVNAFNLLNDLNVMRLTKSFRCNPEIANKVEEFGQKYLEPDFKYEGEESIKPSNNYEVAYLSRTNAALISRMYKLVKDDIPFNLVKSINDIFSLPINLEVVTRGGMPEPKYFYLKKEYDNYKRLYSNSLAYHDSLDYIHDTINDVNVNLATNVIKFLYSHGTTVHELRDKVIKIKKSPNVLLSTVHTFKGLEKDKIVLEKDLSTMLSNAILETLPQKKYEYTVEQQEQFNIYYVALSRAKTGIEMR